MKSMLLHLIGICLLFVSLPAGHAAGLLDTLTFGDEASEKAHSLSANRSEILTGGLGEPARRLLPSAKEDWQGGSVSFTLRIDPALPNYVTLRLWGDDVSLDRLILYCGGKQIGYRHLGDVEILDPGSEERGFNGRFYYRTTPLPEELTKGQTQLTFEIRSTGRMWGYGNTFAQYQHPMKEPTRGLYRLYSHTDTCFTPPPGEKQGALPPVSVRQAPGPAVLEQVKDRVRREIGKALKDIHPPGQQPLHFLARAWFVPWTGARDNPETIPRIVSGLDELFHRYRSNPEIAQNEPGMYNGEWFGLGPAGDVIRLLASPLAAHWDKEIENGDGTMIKRRAAWCEMLIASRDWHRRNRRLYTNQSMITDMNIYRANRGVAVLDPGRALPEAAMLRCLHESTGLQPWLGSETDKGPARNMGDHYLQLTSQGLTKELGFVGYYGEVLDWIIQIYDSTRDPGQPGDPAVKALLEKAARARSVFRYPLPDAEGFRAMRAETVIGWRDDHFPGDVTYTQRDTWDSSGLAAAAVTLEPHLTGGVQQMFNDNQFFQSVADRVKEGGWRVTAGLLDIPDHYTLLQSLPPSPHRLPMTPGQPDFVWTDPEDGVVALKQGGKILYTSLYWRSRHAVNALARVHLIEPGFSRIAVVREEVQFENSGQTWKRPDWTNFGFANGGLRYPGDFHSAHAGELLPIAKVPEGITFKAGQENVFAGKASFYVLHYGPWLIAMNTTQDKTFELPVPGDGPPIKDLVSGRALPGGTPHPVGPLTTMVARLNAPVR